MQQDNFCKTCCSRTVTPRAVIGCGLAELASDWLTLGWRETAVEVGGGAALCCHRVSSRDPPTPSTPLQVFLTFDINTRHVDTLFKDLPRCLYVKM